MLYSISFLRMSLDLQNEAALCSCPFLASLHASVFTFIDAVQIILVNKIFILFSLLTPCHYYNCCHSHHHHYKRSHEKISKFYLSAAFTMSSGVRSLPSVKNLLGSMPTLEMESLNHHHHPGNHHLHVLDPLPCGILHHLLAHLKI